ncbi:hypothetical protein MBFIL_10590 [Methanobrevibacter filiformis]|uniref:Uncharacterized protein n=1 Tax=Methanobrevibacter filiformis TaxID=55758 RepID=A0A166BD71_9EURY|nr:hypothetical protein MBFIL_10590 [Methanobrevibacter filiformis]
MVKFPALYIAPPVDPVLFINLEFIMVKFPVLYIAPLEPVKLFNPPFIKVIFLIITFNPLNILNILALFKASSTTSPLRALAPIIVTFLSIAILVTLYLFPAI